MTTKRTGLIGLGDMGMGMARNLLAAGFPLTGLDLRAERMTMLQEAGGSAAASAAEVGRASDSVFLMVMNGQQIMDLLQGEGGPAGGHGAGRDGHHHGDRPSRARCVRWRRCWRAAAWV